MDKRKMAFGHIEVVLIGSTLPPMSVVFLTGFFTVMRFKEAPRGWIILCFEYYLCFSGYEV
jgi:hypothetical protein